LNSKFDLIIFDCDGVLVDSERVANEVFADVLEQVCGLKFTLEEMFDTFVGHSKIHCLQKVEEMLGHSPPAELALRYEQDIDKALGSSVEAIAGIDSLLQQLQLPYCVASSGSYAKMEMTLGRTGLKRFFTDNIFSSSDVQHGKPHPDIYLHAARRMGEFDPSRCLVIEDSPVGVTGAVAAEMTVFGFAELMPVQKLQAAGAHQVFSQMSDLPALIKSY
jgi:HAD superfamily hydrolase (TIGR01509 family)